MRCTCSAFFLSFYVDFCNKNLNSIKTSANATAKKELLNTDNQQKTEFINSKTKIKREFAIE